MLGILVFFTHLEWTDFFDSSIQYTLYSNKTEILNISAKNSYYISGCTFSDLDSAGAARISDTSDNNHKFLVDASTFDKCEHKSDIGGSLYINSKKGECIQDRICSFGSKSSKMGVYCYIIISSTSPFKNYILDSTISSSGEGNEKSHNLYLKNGETNMRSINISYSKLSYINFYQITSNTNSNITHSTFSNSISTDEYGS